MGARERGRAKTHIAGRDFVWHVERDLWLRIASKDKAFVVALSIVGSPVLRVTGHEFPGVSRSDPRPVHLKPPDLDWSDFGRLVAQLIAWCLDPAHELVPSPAPDGEVYR